MHQRLTKKEKAAERIGVMETGNHFKNRARKKKLTNLFTCFILMFVSFTLSAQTVHNLNSNSKQGTNFLKSANNSFSQEFLKEAKAVREFEINPSMKSANNVKIDDIINLQLFEDKSYTAIVNDIVTDVNKNFTLTLKLPDYPMAFAIITTNTEGKSLITVSIPELGQSFGSRFDINTGKNYLIEIDKDKIRRPNLGNDIVTISQESSYNGNFQNALPQKATKAANSSPITGENPNDPAVIDLLVVYTPQASSSDYANEHNGINNIISTMIALGNISFSNAQTGITLRLVHSEQISYTDDNPENLGNELSRLQNPSDGYMDNVHDIRKQFNADLVQLITKDGGAGFGYISGQSGNYQWGFSSVNVSQVGDDYPCSIHEIGHNMGLGHGANQNRDKADGIFPYSQGWDWIGTSINPYGTNKYCSVMSYWGSYEDDIARYNVPYFSNPNVYHQGQPTGNATYADAARSLREIKHVIAYYSELLNPDVVLNVSPTTYNFPAGGGTSSAITVTSNQSWTVSNNASWLTTSRISGSENNTFTMTATANTSSSSRNATVTVSGGGITREISVTQEPEVPENDFVVINSVSWATSNVDKPGTFAAKPENSGMFYQWNRKIGWSSTNPMINSNGGTEWDYSWTEGETWEKSNDPCPSGWRVPTLNEFESLSINGKVTNEWTTVNGRNGRKFTDITNGKSIFLPAAGYRDPFSDAALLSEGLEGIYWSSTQHDISYAYCLTFNITDVYPGNYWGRNPNPGGSCRCVKESGEVPSLTVSRDTVSFVPAGGETNINVASNQTWSVSSNESWCTVSPTSGSGNGQIWFSAPAFHSTSSRSAIVSVTGGGIIRTINVTQEAMRLDISPTSYNFTVNGGISSAITVNSNFSWTISSNAPWLTTSKTGGSYDDTFTMTAEANGSPSSRSATVTVTTNILGIPKTINVTQDKKASSTYTITFDTQGGSVSPGSITVTYGEAVGTLPTPTRSDYIFGGWWTGTDGSGTQYTSATVYNTEGNITLYAKWINSTGQTWQIGYPNAADVIAMFDNGTLTIYGTGAMQDWWSLESTPWYSLRGNIKNVVINKGVTTIGSWAFGYYNNISSVNIPNTVTTIKNSAFEQCVFTTLNIPESVTSIGNSAFAGCINLTEIHCNNHTPPSCGDGCFWSVRTSTCKLYVPDGTQSSYSLSPCWCFFDIVGCDDGCYFFVQESKHMRLEIHIPLISSITSEQLTTWLSNLDRMYEQFVDLMSGLTPFGGKKMVIRSVADIDVWAFAGDPIQWNASWIPEAFSKISNDGDWLFGMLHEMGHNFSTDIGNGNSSYNFSEEFFANMRMYLALTKIPDSSVETGGVIRYGADIADYYKQDKDPTAMYMFIRLGDYYQKNGDHGYWLFKEAFAIINNLPRNPEEERRWSNWEKFNFFLDILSSCVGRDVRETYTDEELYLIELAWGAKTTWEIGYPNAADIIATYDNGTITISGKGAMQDMWYNHTSLPWYSVKDETTNIVINSGVTTIGNSAFLDFTNLTSVSIGENVATIGEHSFQGCSMLKIIHIENPIPPSVGDWCFFGVNTAICKLYTPRGSTVLYQAAPVWKDFIIIGDVEAEEKIQATEVEISWYEVPSATSYDLTVYSDMGLTQVFDSYSIAAPGQEQNSEMRAAKRISDNRLSYTVSGLSPETPYWYTIAALQNSDTIAIFTEDFITQSITSIDNILANQLQIFPNPAQNELFIKSDLPIKRVEIYSLTGVLLKLENNFIEKISVSNLLRGVYLIKVYTENGIAVSKFMKE